ncbi:MAG TPA: M23 family metallopeptidase [Firmicutes bacterium]|nr:M23 family metallopeptidase [Bacillota bacterium]
MGHLNFDKQSGRKRGWKGFYLALAVCLVAVGGVAVVTFMNTPELAQEGSSAPSTTAPTQAVEQIVTNIPDDRTTTTSRRTTTSAAATTAATTTAAPTTQEPADLFILPLSNEVIQEYSDGKPVYSATMNDWRVHNGVDFKGAEGQTVKALADGTILSVQEDPLWGQVVTIDHGFGIHSRYCGVQVSALQAGQAVKVGQAIGTLDEIPCELTMGPHLHLEVLVNDEYVNPVEAIGKDVKVVTTTASAATTSTQAAATTTTKK